MLLRGLTFSRDGQFLYYQTNERNGSATLNRLALFSGQPAKVKQGLDSPISFSPDGEQFCFVREGPADSELIVADTDGGNERRIAARKLPGYLDYPAWSPDGKRIVCTSGNSARPGGVGLVEVSLHDRAERTVSGRTWWHIRVLKWMHDGSGVLMTAREPLSGIYQIWHVSYPAGQPRRITSGLDSYSSLSLTSDSRLLSAVQERLISSLWIGPGTDASAVRQIAPASVTRMSFAWAPDDQIVYEREPGQSLNLWAMNTDGSNSRQLTFDGQSSHPFVSWNDRSITYVSERSGEPAIWKMDLKGGKARRLTPCEGGIYPEASPDGKWLIYSAWASGKGTTLWKAPAADPSKAARLTDKLALQPSISPDGTHVACFYSEQELTPAVANARNANSIAVLPFEGGTPLSFEIPHTVSVLSGIRWTPDSGALTYVKNLDGISNIWSQPLGGGSPHQLTNFKGDRIFRFAWSRDGRQLALSRGVQRFDVVLIRDLE
ncbi:MAG: PD40 domain-containing protein [Candidatus Solibacter usitatus]|nr:PD40 domain-containing protein [Candidatus Solibacter usitatus]